MAEMRINLEQKQSQTLVITPQLQQAIKLLQYNHLDMVQHIQEAMQENPTLEIDPDNDGSDYEVPEELAHKSNDTRDDLAEQTNGGAEQTVDWEKLLEQLADSGPRQPSIAGGTIHDDLPPIETNLTYGESLADHLVFQLQMARCGEDERRAAETIVHNLDDRGYLTVSLDELGADLGLEAEVLEEALELVQSLDPIGCGSRSVCECLVLQARHHFPEDVTFERILRDHLPHLERRNYGAIARDLGLEIEDVIEYHKMIQELDPLPGRGFGSDDPRYISPDIFVVQHNGDWIVTVNDDGMPDLRISRHYQKMLKNATKEEKEYIIDKLRGAEFLIKSIHKRRRTIKKVTESILKFQREFFEHGVDKLRPLVLQDVADDVGVHMSTVSRVTTNKYVATPHGLFELKFFFSAAVKQQSGGDMASEAIKSRIRQLVAEENQKEPCSDQEIADSLKRDGISVARRTVAKYRDELGILPSTKRKQMF